MSKFSDYQFSSTTQKFIEINGFETPTLIQQKVIPLVSKGRDVIGMSATGTGKTHAFLIPILEKLDPQLKQVQAVITAPTRELALQLYTRASDISKADPNIRVRLISGGIEKDKMNQQLKNQPQIVIGTPGRIKDLFLNDKTLRVDQAKILVVDEADMTLEFGFLDDIDAIAGRMPDNLQMLSFSATIPQGLKPFLKKYMHEPAIVEIDEEQHAPKIDYCLVPCKHKTYEERLLDVLPCFTPYVCLIFANTRVEAAKVAETMRANGYDLIELHGDLQPRERRQAMRNLMNLEKSYVVATDIAARGIDIDGVSHVISLGFPKEKEFFIHRSGSTGRAGREGTCITLYQSDDEAIIKQFIGNGLVFKHKTVKNNQLVELPPLFEKRTPKNDDELSKKISKIVTRKNQKVKPGYKKKRKQEIEKLKRKAHREMIRAEIKDQQKKRAIAKQIAKRNEEN